MLYSPASEGVQQTLLLCTPIAHHDLAEATGAEQSLQQAAYRHGEAYRSSSLRLQRRRLR